MAGKYRRVLLIGAVVVGALTACGQAVDHTRETAVRDGTAPSNVVVRNPPPVSDSTYGTSADVPAIVGNQPLTPLQRRTVGDIQLRLFTTSVTGVADQCTPDSAECVPPWCRSTSALVAEVSNPAMATAQVGSIIGLAQGSQASLLNSVVIGVPEHSPIHLVMLRVATGISQARLTTTGGTDAAAPVNGLAVLVAPSSTDDGTVALLDDNGRTRGTIKLPQGNTAETPACSAQPPPLPEPGKQPADPAAAESAVRAAYTKAFTAVPGDDSYSSLTAVQDGDSLHSALDQLRHNFPQAAASSSVELGDLVFTSPLTAALKFTLNYTGGAPYGTHNGTAVFQNGSWLVSRDSYCAVLAFGGATCPGS